MPGHAPRHGVSQPVDITAKRADFTVASFNFGLQSLAMRGQRQHKHLQQFARVCAKIVEQSEADMLFGCEVGGHRDGLHQVGVDLGDYLRAPFGDGVGYKGINNYWSVYRFGGAAQPSRADPSCSPPDVDIGHGSHIYTLPREAEVDAMVTCFDVHTIEHGKVHAVVGNMHIVCGKKPPSIPVRQRMVRKLQQRLEGVSAPDPHTPVVRIMLGDNNLSSQQVREAVQRRTDKDPLWEVISSTADKGGDNVAVCGADASFVSVAVGFSFTDRGLCNDSHDVVAVRITLRGAVQPADQKRRKIRTPQSSDNDEPAPSAKSSFSDPCEAPNESAPRSPSPESLSSEAPDYSPDEPRSEPADDVLSQEVQRVHAEMRAFWEQRYDQEYDTKMLFHLSTLLFMKRKSPDSAGSDPAGASQPGDGTDAAFAPQSETARSILSVLQFRQDFLVSKSIFDMRHVMKDSERAEIVTMAKESYEGAQQQIELQHADAAKVMAKGKDTSKGKAKGKAPPRDARGASQPAVKGDKGSGKGIKGLNAYVRQQKRKRWHRHLQRICGTKQIWEVLVFSGFFDRLMLEQALHSGKGDEATEPAVPNEASLQERRRLQHAKAEAVSRYLEGKRLARARDAPERRGASQPALSERQEELLRQWRSGQLRVQRNTAAAAAGHGRLESATGDYMDIGGSTGGGSRRVVDSWLPPDWRQFLEHDEGVFQ